MPPRADHPLHMTTVLALCLLASALAVAIAFAMERGAIRARINGANGLALVMVLYASAIGSVVLAVITGFVWSLLAGLAVLAVSAVWHWGAFQLTVGGQQRLANRVTAEGDGKRGN